MIQRGALLLLLTGCATTSVAPRPPLEPLPGPMQIVPSELSPETVLQRAQLRLEGNGFRVPAPIRPENGADRAVGTIALASGALSPTELEAACTGAIEVVQVSSHPAERGSQLHFVCYTEARASIEGACRETRTIGCPRRGDRALGELALDVLNPR